MLAEVEAEYHPSAFKLRDHPDIINSTHLGSSLKASQTPEICTSILILFEKEQLSLLLKKSYKYTRLKNKVI